jgi:hypothetical protein
MTRTARSREKALREKSSEPVAEKLRLAFDLFEAGEEMMRQRLRREFPDAGAAEIERRLVSWLQDRPGAPFGDAEGRPVPWPRRKT